MLHSFLDNERNSSFHIARCRQPNTHNMWKKEYAFQTAYSPKEFNNISA